MLTCKRKSCKLQGLLARPAPLPPLLAACCSLPAVCRWRLPLCPCAPSPPTPPCLHTPRRPAPPQADYSTGAGRQNVKVLPTTSAPTHCPNITSDYFDFSGSGNCGDRAVTVYVAVEEAWYDSCNGGGDAVIWLWVHVSANYRVRRGGAGRAMGTAGDAHNPAVLVWQGCMWWGCRFAMHDDCCITARHRVQLAQPTVRTPHPYMLPACMHE